MGYADLKETKNNFKRYKSIQVKWHIKPKQIKKQTANSKKKSFAIAPKIQFDKTIFVIMKYMMHARIKSIVVDAPQI